MISQVMIYFSSDTFFIRCDTVFGCCIYNVWFLWQHCIVIIIIIIIIIIVLILIIIVLVVTIITPPYHLLHSLLPAEIGVVWMFIGFQYFVFAVMQMFDFLVDDIPAEVEIQLERQEFIIQKVLEELADNVAHGEDVDDNVNPMVIHEIDDEKLVQKKKPKRF